MDVVVVVAAWFATFTLLDVLRQRRIKRRYFREVPPEHREDEWRVRLAHHADGIVVDITNGHMSSNVARVGYNRRRSANPRIFFPIALQGAIGRAESECKRLNGFEPERAS